MSVSRMRKRRDVEAQPLSLTPRGRDAPAGQPTQNRRLLANSYSEHFLATCSNYYARRKFTSVAINSETKFQRILEHVLL